MIDLTHIISTYYPYARIPDEFLFFLQRQENCGHHLRRVHSGELLVPFLANLGVRYNQISDIFSPESKFICQLSFLNLLSMNLVEIEQLMLRKFSTIFDLQEIVLDSEIPTGFNRHGKEHVQIVARKTQRMLTFFGQRSDNQDILKKVALVAGYMHDIGNLLAREHHSFYGVYLLNLLFQEIDRTQESLDAFICLLEAVLFHESDMGQQIPSLSYLQNPTLSLIISDKTDVSFRRVSTKSNVQDAISDVHILVNLLTTSSQVITRKDKLIWKLSFAPKANQEMLHLFPDLLKRAQRVWVPQEWQDLYRHGNIEYIFIFNAAFLRVYFTRISFAVRALFTLSSSVLSFEFIIIDEERGVSLKRVFARENHQEQLDRISRNLFKNNVD